MMVHFNSSNVSPCKAASGAKPATNCGAVRQTTVCFNRSERAEQLKGSRLWRAAEGKPAGAKPASTQAGQSRRRGERRTQNLSTAQPAWKAAIGPTCSSVNSCLFNLPGSSNHKR